MSSMTVLNLSYMTVCVCVSMWAGVACGIGKVGVESTLSLLHSTSLPQLIVVGFIWWALTTEVFVNDLMSP